MYLLWHDALPIFVPEEIDLRTRGDMISPLVRRSSDLRTRGDQITECGVNDSMVRILSVTYCPEKYPLTQTHPPCTNAAQELNTSSVNLIWHPSGEGQTPSRRFPSPVCGGAWIEQGSRLKKTLAAAPPTRRGEATMKWLMHCRTEESAGRERGRRGGKVMDFDSKRKLVCTCENGLNGF